jgi:hypothetical protein
VDARPIPLGRSDAEHPHLLTQFNCGINRIVEASLTPIAIIVCSLPGLCKVTSVREGAGRRPHRIFLSAVHEMLDFVHAAVKPLSRLEPVGNPPHIQALAFLEYSTRHRPQNPKRA